MKIIIFLLLSHMLIAQDYSMQELFKEMNYEDLQYWSLVLNVERKIAYHEEIEKSYIYVQNLIKNYDTKKYLEKPIQRNESLYRIQQHLNAMSKKFHKVVLYKNKQFYLSNGQTILLNNNKEYYLKPLDYPYYKKGLTTEEVYKDALKFIDYSFFQWKNNILYATIPILEKNLTLQDLKNVKDYSIILTFQSIFPMANQKTYLEWAKFNVPLLRESLYKLFEQEQEAYDLYSSFSKGS